MPGRRFRRGRRGSMVPTPILAQEQRVIDLLHELEKAIKPTGYWLQADGSAIYLMATPPETGERVYIKGAHGDRLDSRYIVTRFNIDNDGGDPW